MKFLSLIAALFMFTSLPAQAALIGEKAPDFSAKDVAGETHSLEQHKGKLIVLEWHNPGCPFVRKYYDAGHMQALQKDAIEKGVVWLVVNSGAEGKQGHMTPSAAKEYLAKAGATPSGYILDADGKIGQLYGAKTTPHMFVIDKHGTLVYAGAIDSVPSADAADIAGAKNYVKAALDALLTDTPVAVTQTQAYGCSVKYAD